MPPVYADLARGALPAAGGKDQRTRLNEADAFSRDDGKQVFVVVTMNCAHKRECPYVYAAFRQLVDKPRGVFRAGELFAEANKPEAIVDALFEDAAEARFPLDEQRFCACAIGGKRGGKSGGACADDGYVELKRFHHDSTSLIAPTSSSPRGALLSISNADFPVSSAMICNTSGPQNPP